MSIRIVRKFLPALYPSESTLSNASTVLDFTVDKKYNTELKSTSTVTVVRPSYNPLKDRNMENLVSGSGMFFVLLSVNFGISILVMPFTFKSSGLVTGIIVILAVITLVTHSIYILITSSQELCRKVQVPALDYEETAGVSIEKGPQIFRKLAFTFKVYTMVQLFLACLIVDSVLVIYLSDTLYRMIEKEHQLKLDFKVYTAMLWFPLLILSDFKSLRYTVPLAVVSSFSSIGVYIIGIYQVCKIRENKGKIVYVASVTESILCFCNIIFLNSGILIVMTVENESQNPRYLIRPKSGLVYIIAGLLAVMLSVIGPSVYLLFGEEIDVNFLFNLPLDDDLTIVAKVLSIVAIFLLYPVIFYVPLHILWNPIHPKVPPKLHKYSRFLLRTLLVSLTILFSLILPALEVFIPLVGSIFFVQLAVIIPPLIDTLIRWPHLGKLNWILMKNLTIVVMAFLGMLTGAYLATVNVLKRYNIIR